ncbi:hypothetical protein DYADSP32_1395, partial [Dyadobacter sp. 32]
NANLENWVRGLAGGGLGGRRKGGKGRRDGIGRGWFGRKVRGGQEIVRGWFGRQDEGGKGRLL